MDTYLFLVAVAVIAVFLAGYCFEVLDSKWKLLLLVKYCGNTRVGKGIVLRAAGYDHAGVVKRVSRRAGISSPELLFIRRLPGVALACSVNGKNVIMCDSRFASGSPAKEFEGAVAHEIAHLCEYPLHQNFQSAFMGFLFCAAFSCTMFVAALFFDPRFAVMFLKMAFGFLCFTFFCLTMAGILRRRAEYRADRRGLALTRYPWSMVHFLWRCALIRGPKSPHVLVRALRFVGGRETHPSMRRRAEAALACLETQKRPFRR
ncbi:MAG: M48 family metalloprotease [Parcubacteria group bacterium]|nr:M48 family metalloprotease [Parcubacteria group bacterium]